MPPLEHEEILRLANKETLERFALHWPFQARENQTTPPGEWRVWLVLAGRGWGKTRVGAEWVREQVETGRARRIALVGRTAADVRDVMVEGSSGILSCASKHYMPKYEPSKRRLTWPRGEIATTYSGDEPNLLRGPQHDAAWCDELAAFRFTDSWDQLLFGLRIGDDPRCVVTTTPRPTKIIKGLVADGHTFLTKGDTFANAENLAPQFLETILEKYKGTTLGRQELFAEILDDIEGALWRRETIENSRVDIAPAMRRIVVAIDPAATSKKSSDETGMVEVGLGVDGHGYILGDMSGRMSPDAWGRKAIAAWESRGDRIIAEVNNGGEMVAHVLKTINPNVAYSPVHASRGKISRAEPIAALYEQGKIHHVGFFPELEDQMCTYVASASDSSPDRMDALVWGLSFLFQNTSVLAKPADGLEQPRPWGIA